MVQFMFSILNLRYNKISKKYNPSKKTDAASFEQNVGDQFT